MEIIILILKTKISRDLQKILGILDYNYQDWELQPYSNNM